MSVVLKKYKQYKGLIVPIVGIGIRYGGLWHLVEAYVDSGATYSVFRAGVAERIGLDFKKGKFINVEVGDGDKVPVFLHNLDIQLGGEIFGGTIGFSEKLGIGFNLLGRKSIFDKFKVCFDEKKRIVTFQNLTN